MTQMYTRIIYDKINTSKKCKKSGHSRNSEEKSKYCLRLFTFNKSSKYKNESVNY